MAIIRSTSLPLLVAAVFMLMTACGCERCAACPACEECATCPECEKCTDCPACKECPPAEFDYAAAVKTELRYISQCSMSEANPLVHVEVCQPGYGAVNEWRIGNGAADSVNPGTSAIGMVGLLYGYARVGAPAPATADLDGKVTAALRAFFWKWVAHPDNQIKDGENIGFPTLIRYKADGTIQEKNGTANAGTTAEMLIAMNKYRQLSPNGDRDTYTSQMYGTAHFMAQYIDGHFGSWTTDRSYVVAAFHGFGHWATAVGDTGTAEYYHGRADTVSASLALAQDGANGNYYSYLDAGNNGVYDNGNADQGGFAPYEFNARKASEEFAGRVASFWDHGTFSGLYMTVQSGPLAGGVHQRVPDLAAKVYPGPSFQLADAEWKMGRKDEAWQHYRFALSSIGSETGSGCWVDNPDLDSFAGGFIDWVDGSGNRPDTWQRFVDTSAYMIVATEELAFDSAVDWSY